MEYIVKEKDFFDVNKNIKNTYYGRAYSSRFIDDMKIEKNERNNYELKGTISNYEDANKVPFSYDYRLGKITIDKNLSEKDINMILEQAYLNPDISKEKEWFGFPENDYRLNNIDTIKGKITERNIKELSSLSDSINFYAKDVSSPRDTVLTGTYKTLYSEKAPIPYFLSKDRNFIASTVLTKSGFQPIPEYKNPESSINKGFIKNDVHVSNVSIDYNNKMTVSGWFGENEIKYPTQKSNSFIFDYQSGECSRPSPIPYLDKEVTPDEYKDIISSIVYDEKAYENAMFLVDGTLIENTDTFVLNNKNQIKFGTSGLSIDFESDENKFYQICYSDIGKIPGPKNVSDLADSFINKEVDKKIEETKISTAKVADGSIRFYSSVMLPSNITGGVSGNYDPVSKILRLNLDYNTTSHIKEGLLHKTAKEIDEREKNGTLYPEGSMNGKEQNLFTLESLLKNEVQSHNNLPEINPARIELYKDDEENVRFHINDREIYGTFNLADRQITKLDPELNQTGIDSVKMAVNKAVDDELTNIAYIEFNETGKEGRFDVLIEAGEKLQLNINGTYEDGKLNINNYADYFSDEAKDRIEESVNEAFFECSSLDSIKDSQNRLSEKRQNRKQDSVDI